MKVSEVFSSPAQSISSNAMVSEAAIKMKKFDLGFLPVLEYCDFVGVLTDRDIVVRAVAEEKDTKTTVVKDVICTGIFSCSDEN